MRFVSEIGMIRMSMLVGLSIIFIMALTGVFLAAPAQAATISCGQCHGAYINNLDGTTTLISGTSPFEDVNTPQADNIAGGIGRGLHGIHMNYSSASYGKASGRTTRGNCSYCHNSYVHQSGFVTFSGMSPTARQKTGSTGLNGKVSGTGTGPNGMDITLIDGTASCSAACHKGTSAASPALWGNYTSPSIRLSCASCHDDVSTKDAAGFSLSGAHKQHLQSVITVNGGSLMGAAGNAGCVNCHPDNTGEGKLSLKKPDGTWSDDGSKKAYPHASDGTHVVFDNASVIAKVAATKAGLNTTCTGSCHNNTTVAKWGDSSLACDACHYYADPPTHDGNEVATVKLSGSHSSHFSTGTITCSNCHTVPATGDTSHAHSLPPVPQNATLLASLN